MFTGKINVIEPFDGGGLGVLLQCRDEAGLTFAAKFPKDGTWESQRLIDDEERRFVRHQGRHVVQYYGPLTAGDGRRGFAMELMAGSLAGMIRAQGALAVPVALGYFCNVAAALAEVHQSAPMAFHGDVKTANVLYRGRSAKLADFGLARGGLGQTQMFGPHSGGTPGYFPPEGFASPAGDIYSLGVLMLALLTGREPSEGRPLQARLPAHPRLIELLQDMLAPMSKRLNMDGVLARLPDVNEEARRQAGSSVLGKVIGGAALAALAVGVVVGLKKASGRR